MELFGCFGPIIDFANDNVMNFTLRMPSLSFGFFVRGEYYLP